MFRTPRGGAAALVLTLSLSAGTGWLALAADAPRERRSGVDRSTFDTSVRPQDDLFRHVNGSWLKNQEIPAERADYGSFTQLIDRAEAHLREIIEAAAKSGAKAGTVDQQVGDLFASFMDEERVEKLGLDPIKPDLEKVAAVKDKDALVKLVAERERQGMPGLFGAGVSTDAKQSDRYILHLAQGGIGLPDESFYRDDRMKDIRAAYRKHVAALMKLAGQPDPEGAAETVLNLETRIAKSHWDRVKSRDASLTYNKKTREELASLAPGVNWDAWFEGTGLGNVREVVVMQPDALAGLSETLRDVPLDAWKTYLTFHTVRASAPLLSKAFVDEAFNFSRVLSGATENRPRWKRGVTAVEAAMGEAVGKLYVAKHFPPAAKERMKDLVKNLIEAYREDIASLDWMSSETRKKALDKLAKFTPKVGYPDKWRDYTGLEVRRDDLVGNMRRSAAFEHAYEIGKLGKPVDRDEWHMTPQTVNAYYNPGMNEIVFPAAILQPPFFDLEADDAVNYGGIVAVIGHEVGHGFDDQGSKYDGDGNLKNWWTESDRKEFESRAKKLVGQYNAFSPAQLPGQHVNGAFTLGENIGDLGGLTLAYKAYKRSLGGKPSATIDGLTGEQRLFIGWAQVWRRKYRDAEMRKRLVTDPHSPAEFRCNGVVRNLPEFYEAFGVKEGDKLYLAPGERVRIW